MNLALSAPSNKISAPHSLRSAPVPGRSKPRTATNAQLVRSHSNIARCCARGRAHPVAQRVRYFLDGPARRASLSSVSSFTLLELLIVLGILALLAGLTVPTIKSLTRSNVMAGANQQLLDDIAFARQRAINGRTVVSMVFMPPVLSDPKIYNFLDQTQQNQMLGLQFTAYTFFAERSVGDQPGRPFRRYLGDWKTLPDGVFIATNKYYARYLFTNAVGKIQPVLPFDYREFPYPTSDNVQTVPLAYIAFDPQGHLVYFDPVGRIIPAATNCVIPLARGSIFLERDGNGVPIWAPAAPSESGGNNSQSTNTYNQIEIDAMTGRAVLDRRSI